MGVKRYFLEAISLNKKKDGATGRRLLYQTKKQGQAKKQGN